MKYNIAKLSKAALLAVALSATSCVNDLDVKPIDPNMATPEKVYVNEAAFEQAMAKIYAGFVVSGQQGPSGNGDLGGLDEGHSQYWRGYWVAQELPTDEVLNAWGDPGLPDMSTMSWSASNVYLRSFYSRAIYQVSLANEFLRNAGSYGKSEYKNLARYKAEVRYLRAFAYWHALDLFGNLTPLVKETDKIGTLPSPAGKQVQGTELFKYIEAELQALINGSDLPAAGLTANIGQAHKGAARMLLAKLYLNHKVYTGTEDKKYYTDAKAQLAELVKAGYGLIDAADVKPGDKYTPYQRLFLADNHTANEEIIFSFNVDGVSTQSWGAGTYLLCASIDAGMSADFGVSNGWAGNRATPELTDILERVSGDQRALLEKSGRTKGVEQLGQYKQGFAVVKYRNKKRDGGNASNAGSSQHPDFDIPVFRMADAYLMMAEIEVRNSGTVTAETLKFLNDLRKRAVTRANGSLAETPVELKATDVTLNWLLEERARELYWEGHRRTDLRRFGKFTGGSYLWAFKGGVASGKSVDSRFETMPIPDADANANPNLIRTPGY